MAAGKSRSRTDEAIASLEERVNTLGQMVFGSENFNKAVGTALDTGVRLQRGFSDKMAQGLNFYNLPSQDDIVALGQQCARIEEHVVRIEAALLQLVEDKSSRPVAGPPRTKQAKPKAKPATAVKKATRQASAKTSAGKRPATTRTRKKPVKD